MLADFVNSLLGGLQITFRPGQEEAPISLAPGGLFLPGPDGRPQNTRISGEGRAAGLAVARTSSASSDCWTAP